MHETSNCLLTAYFILDASFLSPVRCALGCHIVSYFFKKLELAEAFEIGNGYFCGLQLNKLEVLSREISISEMLQEVFIFIHVESVMNKKVS